MPRRLPRGRRNHRGRRTGLSYLLFGLGHLMGGGLVLNAGRCGAAYLIVTAIVVPRLESGVRPATWVAPR